MLSLLLLAAPDWWRKKGEPEPEPDTEAPAPDEPEATAAEPPPAADSLPVVDDLFPDGLPARVGPVPQGLPNLSAQGCNGCHYAAHDGWAGSPHAAGARGAHFQQAAADAGTPACTACHLPLVEQSPRLAVYAEGDADRPDRVPNPDFDATLHTEGVTCAACHVRDGVVLGTDPSPDAPHPVASAPSLGNSAFCASCHQLTWPGADEPLYDTWGEWARSPQGRAGIQCQDCHVRAAASPAAGPDHAFPAQTGRGLSLLVETAGVALTRGGDPLPVTLRLQNTGAGHAVPTGSPFQAVVLRAVLLGPPGEDGESPTEAAELTAELARTLEDGPPWATVEDTRLAAGGERAWSWEPALDVDAPGGDWFLQVTLTRRVRGELAEAPLLERRIPLRVD